MICRQIAKYRAAKETRALMMEGGQVYADGVVDVEKGVLKLWLLVRDGLMDA